MRWSLLLSDLSARLIGMFFLASLAAGFLATQDAVASGDGDYILLALFAPFALFKAVQFLWPKSHERTIARTQSGFHRYLFINVTSAYLAVSTLVLVGTMPDPDEHPAALFAVFASLLIWLLYLVFFYFGVGYRAALEQAKEDLARGGQPEMLKYNEAYLQRTGQIRKSDLWDVIVIFPTIVPLALALIGLHQANTVASLDMHIWQGSNTLAIFVPTVVVLALCGLIFARRPPTSAMHARWGPAKRILIGAVLAPPLIGFFLLLTGPTVAFPWAWNLITANPVETRLYEVARPPETTLGSDCLSLRPAGTQVSPTRICGLSDDMIGAIRDGQTIQGLGEVSPFGQTLTRISIAS